MRHSRLTIDTYVTDRTAYVPEKNQINEEYTVHDIPKFSLLFSHPTRRKIVEVILLNFRSNLGHKDKLEVI